MMDDKPKLRQESRRLFLKKIGLGVGLISFASHLHAQNEARQAKRMLRFGIISDQHHDLILDAKERLSTFLHEAQRKEVDFVIDLGDFVFPKEGNRDFISLWHKSPLTRYNVLGNHDMDTGSKEDFMKFVGMTSPYYSFDKNGVHFIVLDANYLYQDGKYIPYKNANFYVDSKQRAWVNPEQLEWLKADLRGTDKPTIIFSHQSIERCVANRAELRAILENENKRVGYSKVIAAFSGHDHTDYHLVINGITYIQINSSCYQWVGEKYANRRRFSKEEYEKRPALAYVLAFDKPLFAFVDVIKEDDSTLCLEMEGRQSSYIPPSPEELGIKQGDFPYPLTPVISDFRASYPMKPCIQ